jgi:hypothetical protein
MARLKFQLLRPIPEKNAAFVITGDRGGEDDISVPGSRHQSVRASKRLAQGPGINAEMAGEVNLKKEPDKSLVLWFAQYDSGYL